MAKNNASKKVQKLSDIELGFDLPTTQDFLKAGTHFGHQSKRWDPLMGKYIYTQRDRLHIIDVSQTYDLLEKSLRFLVQASSRGPVIFVGTKRQARTIVRDSAVEAGAHFITHRWVGGLLTNFDYIRRSLTKLDKLEKAFESGIEGRTKFEISRMKKEWDRLNRLYEGVKTLSKNPTAVVVLDTKFERNAVREARRMGVPVVGVVDTNADPSVVDYPIPANDDALASITLFFNLFMEAVKQGNKGKGVRHDFKDYTKVEVERKKVEEEVEEVEKEVVGEAKSQKPKVRVSKAKKGEGILEGVQKAKEAGKTSSEVKEEKPAKKSKKKATSKKADKATEEISGRTIAALEEAKVSLEDARKMSEKDLLDIKGIGQKSVEEIKG